MLNLTIIFSCLILQALVVYYGYKLYKILNPVRYWSTAWLLYTIANLLILIRRVVGIFLIDDISGISAATVEYLIQVAVSILLLIFGKRLSQLYSKYFNDGLNLQSWKEEQDNKEK